MSLVTFQCHTYSAYARDLHSLWGMYQWLDRAAKGRNEEGLWFRRHDEYSMWAPLGFDPKPTVRQIRATPVLTFNTGTCQRLKAGHGAERGQSQY